jgi:YD repeat-containing protein
LALPVALQADQAKYFYDEQGRLIAVVDGSGNAALYAYDAVGNLLSIERFTVGTGEIGIFFLNPSSGLPGATAVSNIECQVLPCDIVACFRIHNSDTADNLTALVDPLGNTTTRLYDLVSRLVGVVDPRGAITRFSYDPLNQVTQIQDALGGLTSFTTIRTAICFQSQTPRIRPRPTRMTAWIGS